MPFSHHSHSGQFCPGHARNTLDEMLQTAIAKKMSVFALTEHMPRHEVDFYPEEREDPYRTTFQGLLENERAFLNEAVRLRAKYQYQDRDSGQDQNRADGVSAEGSGMRLCAEEGIGVPVGFESDWIRESDGEGDEEGPGGSLGLIERSLSLRSSAGEYGFDFFVGSVHHVHTVPIDYSPEDYVRAQGISGGRGETLFEDYFDAQFAMLQAVRPPVVGHFDLIRLMSEEPDGSLERWKGVWKRVLRNLDFIQTYAGLVELNFSAVRKGMKEPYPKGEVCRAFVSMGGRFVVSDDSHGVEQVAFGYDLLMPFLEDVGINELHFLRHAKERLETPYDVRFPHLAIAAINLDELKKHPFWSVTNNP